MARLVIENLTIEQAKELAHWYSGQGEQDVDCWFENKGIRVPYSNCQRVGGCIEVDKENDTVTLFTVTHEGD